MDNEKIEQLMKATGVGRRAAGRQLRMLQLRYGKRKAVKTMLGIAVAEVVAMQARVELDELETK